ncbi:ATP-dependent DNA helicase PcrA [compost metagenome]
MPFSTDQQNIINFEGGHAIIMACPGSGKTTTMTARILHLLRKGVNPKRISVLMFGSSAQKDFVKKMTKAANNQFAVLPDIRTFHSLCMHLCSLYTKMGLMPDCRLEVSNTTQEFMAKDAMKAALASISDDGRVGYVSNDELDIDTFISYIEMIKATLLTPEEVFSKMDINGDEALFVEAYKSFEELRKENKIRFFSDLIYDLVVLLQEKPDICNVIANHKDYILVDEYQDTNKCQAVLLKIIAGERAKVMVVGDVDQAIYEWRGGDPQIMLHDFQNDFKGATLLPLTETYRYGTGVSFFANNLIKNNIERFDTVCRSNINVADSSIHIYRNSDHGKEAVKIVKEHLARGKALNEIVVLVRMYSHSAGIELAFIEAGIDYYISNGHNFLQSEEVKTLMSVLELSNKMFPSMDVSERETKIKSLLKFPHIGLKNDVLTKMAHSMAIRKGDYFSDLDDVIPDSVKRYHRERILRQCHVLELIENGWESKRSYEGVLNFYVSSTGLYDWISTSSLIEVDADESISRCDVFMSFVNGIRGSLQDKIDKINLMSKREISDKSDCVLITSIHKSKGLEWNTVIVPSLIEKSFPYFHQDGMPNMEAERRLFFVAITRCIEHVHLLTVESSIFDKPSRFIGELKHASLVPTINLPALKKEPVESAEAVKCA